MPRSKNGTRRRDRRRKIMRLAKGYWGGRSRLFKTAKEAVMKGLASSYRDRRRKKGEFRRLWITRLSAAVRQEGMNYSRFMPDCRQRRSSSTERRSPTWPSRIRSRSRPLSSGLGKPWRQLRPHRNDQPRADPAAGKQDHSSRRADPGPQGREGTLRKGLESAQKRMRELESLVDGFKTDQKEIESVILRTLHHLDELEESVHSSRKTEPAVKAEAKVEPATHAVSHAADPRPVGPTPAAARRGGPAPKEASEDEAHSAKEELDIF